jgi:hypothetical protein
VPALDQCGFDRFFRRGYEDLTDIRPQGLFDPGAVGEWIPDGLVKVDVEDRIQLSKEL